MKRNTLNILKNASALILCLVLSAGAAACTGGQNEAATSADADTSATLSDTVPEKGTEAPEISSDAGTSAVSDESSYAPEQGGDVKASLDGKNVMFIGNSMIYYGGAVTKGGYRGTDSGWFKNICTANGMNTTVIDCTYGSHHLYDFSASGCKTSGCDVGVGGDLLKGIDLNKIDVVFMSESGDNNSGFVNDVKNVMKRFENPNTVFVYMAHTYTYTKNHTNIINNLQKLKDEGVIIVDWGHVCYDIYSGKVKVPGGTMSYSKNTFVNNCSGDSHHPNPLAGYIAAQMCFSAVTGKSAVGQPYDMRTKINYGSGSVSYSAYSKSYYTSGTSNFAEVFESEADMNGIQQLMDSYLERWDAAPSDRPADTSTVCEHVMKETAVIKAATEYLPGLHEYTCEKCGRKENKPVERLSSASVNIAAGADGLCFSAGKASFAKPVFLTDGDIADNASSSITNAAWTSGGNSDSFGGKLPGDVTAVHLADANGGADHGYYYVVKIDLGAPKTVDGYAVYIQGYKKTVLDTGVDILVSGDGEHWTVVDSFDKAGLFSGVKDGSGYENYIDSDTAAASAADYPCYLAGKFDPMTDIRYVAYGCTGFREINGYYAARFTEFEVYGK
ncbi:MAG: hypothetical protein MJ137_01130 [Clostridia bacterium]|nr:hypothetical protein [Clostridia bacterium]